MLSVIVTVGALVSTGWAAAIVAAAMALPGRSVTAPAFRLSPMLPSVLAAGVTVTLYLAPLPVTDSTLPLLTVKPLAARPLTASLNDSE